MSAAQDPSIKETAFYKQATEYLRSVDLGDFADAPADNKPYARRNRDWVEVAGDGTGITDAPSDDKQYARINGEWAEVVAGGGDFSPSYELKDASFTAEAGKSYACDTSPVTVIPAVMPTLTAGGLKFTGSTVSQSTAIELFDDGDLYVNNDDAGNLSIAYNGGTTTLQDIVDLMASDGSGLTTVALAPGSTGSTLAGDINDSLSGGVAGSSEPIPFAVTLPSSPATGDVVVLADARGTWGSNPLEVLRNGKKIESGTANFTNNAAGTFFAMVYIDNTTGWRVLASGTKPLNLTAPTVTGTYDFTATNGTWTGSPTSFAYQWQMSDDGETGWADIEDETAASYLALEADEGKFVRVGVIATNANGPSVKVYSSASSAIDVPDFPTSGLLAFYKLSDLTDSSGNGNTLTNNNTVTFGAGKIGNAAAFDGSNYFTASDASFPSGNTSRTLSLWLKTSSSALMLPFAYGNGNTGQAFMVQLYQGGVCSEGWNNYVATDTNIADNAWHHIVITHNSSNDERIVWVDGVIPDVLSSNAGTLNTVTETNGLYIGKRWDGYSFTGQIDAIGLWDRVLTNEEIVQLYNSGNGVEP